jgi:four helix bundle suffix protein
MELKLTQVARASLEELRLDYEDFLRQRRLQQWSCHDPLREDLIARRCVTAEEVAAWVRQVYESGQGGLSGLKASRSQSTSSKRSTYAEIAANAALVLINVAAALLDRQIASQAQAFESEGGFSERLYRMRARQRTGRDQT